MSFAWGMALVAGAFYLGMALLWALEDREAARTGRRSDFLQVDGGLWIVLFSFPAALIGVAHLSPPVSLWKGLFLSLLAAALIAILWGTSNYFVSRVFLWLLNRYRRPL